MAALFSTSTLRTRILIREVLTRLFQHEGHLSGKIKLEGHLVSKHFLHILKPNKGKKGGQRDTGTRIYG